MDNNDSGYLWHLLALLLLWGLAGKLDEPPEGWPDENAEVYTTEARPPGPQPVHLHCAVDPMGPHAHRSTRRRPPGADLVSFQPHHLTTREPTPRVVHLECLVATD